MLHALRRAAILFALGLVVYAYPRFDLATQRIPGVLQRLAVCYLIATLIYLTTGVRGQILWIGGLLTTYWLLMMLVPVPGYGAGRLDVEGNLAHYVDRIVFGAHNYAHTKTWDPEGLVSTLPSIATALFGVLAGHILRIRKSLAERTAWLFLTGNILLAAGQIASYWMPINKKLWTSSFSVYMAGLDFVIFAAFVWLVDGNGYQRFMKPLSIMGMNAIAVYMASEMGEEFLDWSGLHSWAYTHMFAPLASPENASLLYAIAYTGVIYLIAYGLYRKRWFLKV
jgi:predicted acyltransferase